MKLNKTRIVTSMLIVAAVGTVIVQNTQPVQSRFFVVGTTMPQAALMGIMMIAGFSLGMAFKDRIVACWQATSDFSVRETHEADVRGTVAARTEGVAPVNAETAKSTSSLSA